MRFMRQDEDDPNRITRIIIEKSDLIADGVGIEIQIEGFKASPEELDITNTHIYCETWDEKTRFVVWNQTVDPVIFNLDESEDDLDDLTSHNMFRCNHCQNVYPMSMSKVTTIDDKQYCPECEEGEQNLIQVGCGCMIPENKVLTHSDGHATITCCETCYERIK